MKKFMYAGVSAVALMAVLAAVPANAADIYRRDAAPSLKDGPSLMGPAWEGLYLGGHAGYAWTDVEVNVRGRDFDADDFIGGVQIGYNLQRGNIVYGVEVDLGYLGLDADSPHYSADGGFYGDLTGRLGLTFGNTLVYAKGGAAFLDAEFKYGSSSIDDTVWGWTVGGGVEHMLSRDVSLKAEYRHFEFDGDDLKIGNTKFEPTVDAVTFGVNYHINRGTSLLK